MIICRDDFDVIDDAMPIDMPMDTGFKTTSKG